MSESSRNENVLGIGWDCNELLDVIENGLYAVQHGDSDILEAFEKGAKRVLVNHNRRHEEEDDE